MCTVIPLIRYEHTYKGPYQGGVLTPAQQDFNTSMSTIRSSVEWIFGDIVNYFKFIDFKKNLKILKKSTTTLSLENMFRSIIVSCKWYLKIGLNAVEKMYVTCALMQNARSILYGSATPEYFGLNPPTLEECFI